MKQDIYQRITDQIVSELEKGVRPWMKPWNAEHAAGRITRPPRGNGIPYRGINILVLWSAAMEKGFAAPVWMTYRQATELKANVRKGEHGSLVVYADKIIRTETDTATGEEAERAIPFMKGFTVFNVEQIDGLPEHYYAKPAPRTDTIERIERAERFSQARERPSGTAGRWPIIMSRKTSCRCRLLRPSATPKATMRRWRMRPRIMPTSGLCRAACHGSRNPGHSGEATRHNQRDSRTASVSSGRFRPGLEASLPTECTRFGAVSCRTIYEWPLPLWQKFDPVKPARQRPI
jgi:hypothetical protein